MFEVHNRFPLMRLNERVSREFYDLLRSQKDCDKMDLLGKAQVIEELHYAFDMVYPYDKDAYMNLRKNFDYAVNETGLDSGTLLLSLSGFIIQENIGYKGFSLFVDDFFGKNIPPTDFIRKYLNDLKSEKPVFKVNKNICIWGDREGSLLESFLSDCINYKRMGMGIKRFSDDNFMFAKNVVYEFSKPGSGQGSSIFDGYLYSDADDKKNAESLKNGELIEDTIKENSDPYLNKQAFYSLRDIVLYTSIYSLNDMASEFALKESSFGRDILFLRVNKGDDASRVLHSVEKFYDINDFEKHFGTKKLKTQVPIIYLIFPDNSYKRVAREVVDSELFVEKKKNNIMMNRLFFAEPVYSEDLKEFNNFKQEYERIIVSSEHVSSTQDLFKNAFGGILYSGVLDSDEQKVLIKIQMGDDYYAESWVSEE